MLLTQLTESARLYLTDHGYTNATIYHDYVWHWNAFSKTDFIPGTSMSEARIRQPLTTESSHALARFRNHLEELNYKDKPKKYSCSIVNSFLLNCPFETMDDESIRGYFFSLYPAKIGVHGVMSHHLFWAIGFGRPNRKLNRQMLLLNRYLQNSLLSRISSSALVQKMGIDKDPTTYIRVAANALECKGMQAERANIN